MEIRGMSAAELVELLRGLSAPEWETPSLCAGWSVRDVVRPGRRSKGPRLVATDLDWATGSGPEVRGSAEALALAVVGRTSVLDELEGEGLAELAPRLTRIDPESRHSPLGSACRWPRLHSRAECATHGDRRRIG
ncbi:maleylpyruvate isomerase N-terminal domain-containing protein [Nocardia xishanensis]|uniref:Maleylpyruvate isomerase N-terminal domain-containing protein n=1 Tax=Nocardia xishanensis TaxID=238964 RepID=A0ABW7X831_9NOCA